jgi:hypothetical protein
MSDFQHEMNRVVEVFVAQISELARRAAIGTLESAFGGRSGRGNGARAQFPASIVASPVGRPRGGRGGKRTAADLEALATKFAAFVTANPGLRIEEINKELGTTTKDLALPIRKLVSESLITGKGQKRSTKYFPGRKAK